MKRSNSKKGQTVMSLKEAIELLQRKNARLMFMFDNSSPSGKSYFIVPGRRVALETAERIIKRDDVRVLDRGLIPESPQTWEIIR